MPVPTPIKGVAIEDGGATLLARIVGNDAVNITQASISTITYDVYRQSDANNTDIQQNSPLTVASVIFDTLQVDAVWTVDSIGYNFSYAADALEIPTGKEVFVFQFKFTPGTGQPFFALYEIDTLGLIGS